jgi:glutathione reductase (NADPH)
MIKEYDLIVIGTGPAGRTVLAKCQEGNLKVAAVESRKFGGTCALRGCNPKKVLAGAAEVIARSADMCGRGIKRPCEIAWPELIQFKRTFTDGIPKQVEKELHDLEIDTYHGSAKFTGRSTIRVKEDILSAKHFFIGSGSRPRPLNIEGEELVLTSDQFMERDELPQSIIFIGGGYISMEFAHIAARAGSKVIILELTERLLPKFDQDLVAMLVEESKTIGIEAHVNMPVSSVKKQNRGFTVYAGKNGETHFKGGLVVHGAGRIPDIDHLGLEDAQVTVSKQGIEVNDCMQSISNPSIFAAGDAVTTPFQLTPTAEIEAKVAAKNIIKENSAKLDTFIVPSAVFTVPPLASVGMGEDDLKEGNVEYEEKFWDSFPSSKRIGLKRSGAKIFVDKNTNRILGAHLFLPHAEEVINIIALAMRNHLTVDQLNEMVWTFPTSFSDITEIFR